MNLMPRLKAGMLTLILLAIQSCSGETARETVARERGISDANEYIGLAGQKKISQLQLQSFLLEVREREARLRQIGETTAAEAYISNFEKQLQDSMPDLFNQLYQK